MAFRRPLGLFLSGGGALGAWPAAALKARLRVPLTVVSVSRKDGCPICARFTPGGAAGWDGPIKPHLVASCAIPTLFPPVRLKYKGRQLRLVDGGVACRLPLEMTALAACRDIVVIQTVPRRAARKESVVERRSRARMRGLIGAAISRLTRANPDVRVFCVSPSMALPIRMLDFRAEGLRHALGRGFYDARRFLKDPAGFQVGSPGQAGATL